MSTIARIMKLNNIRSIIQRCPSCQGDVNLINLTSRRYNGHDQPPTIKYKFFIECRDPRCKIRSMELSCKDYFQSFKLIKQVIDQWNNIHRNYLIDSIITKEDRFGLTEAIDLCRLGYFVTHELFDNAQSMHMYKNHLYYEDGPDLTANELGFDIHTEEFANRPDSWMIKYIPEEIDYRLLDKLHSKTDKLGINYELCVIPTDLS